VLYYNSIAVIVYNNYNRGGGGISLVVVVSLVVKHITIRLFIRIFNRPIYYKAITDAFIALEIA
jgi:hypothetical protein